MDFIASFSSFLLVDQHYLLQYFIIRILGLYQHIYSILYMYLLPVSPSLLFFIIWHRSVFFSNLSFLLLFMGDILKNFEINLFYLILLLHKDFI